MKILGVFVMVMRDALEVKLLVLFVLFTGGDHTISRIGQRLPSHAKNQQQCDPIPLHAIDRNSVQFAGQSFGGGETVATGGRVK